VESSSSHDGACTACPAGKFKESTGLSPCISCGISAHSLPASTDSGDCMCITGTQRLNGTDVCEDCLPGTYAALTLPASCTMCLAHSSSPARSTNLSDCFCNAGWSDDIDVMACLSCNPGTYKASAGAGGCDKCQVSHWNMLRRCGSHRHIDMQSMRHAKLVVYSWQHFNC